MIQRFPKRYKKKKQIVFKRLKNILKKWNAYILTTSSRKTTLYTEFDMGKWKETVVVSMKDGEVKMNIQERMLVQFNVERKYKTDPELLNAFKNYFVC